MHPLKLMAIKALNAIFGLKGDSVPHVIGLYGLPRSGTTVLTAMIGAHSKAASVYEPWHSKRLGHNQTHVADLMPLVRARGREITLVCLKETATKSDYLTHLEGLLDDASTVGHAGLIWIVRRPIDTFLSQFAADRRWRKGTFRPDPRTLRYWAEITYATFCQMGNSLEKYNSRIVFYEHFTAFPEQTLRDLMPLAGLEFEIRQLDYHKTFERRLVRGDRFVIDEARPVTIQVENKYASQIAELKEAYTGNEHLTYILELSGILSQYSDQGVITPPNSIVREMIDCGINIFPKDEKTETGEF